MLIYKPSGVENVSLAYFQRNLTNSVLSAVKTLFVLLFKSDLDLRKSLLSNLGYWRFREGLWAWICILSMKSCRCQTVKPPHTTHINMHTYTKPLRTALTPIQSLILSVKKQLWRTSFYFSGPLLSISDQWWLKDNGDYGCQTGLRPQILGSEFTSTGATGGFWLQQI